MVVGVVGHLILSASRENAYSHIFTFTYDALIASGRYTVGRLLGIKVAVYLLNVMASLAPILTLMAGCALFCRPPSRGREELRRLSNQIARVKLVVGAASLLLVTGILHMIAWVRWPSVLTPDPVATRGIIEFSGAVGLYWGAVFSALIASFYLPAALNLNRRAKRMLDDNPDLIEGAPVEKWLRKNGLSVAPMQQLPQLVAVFAPLLAGPFGTALASLPQTLVGG